MCYLQAVRPQDGVQEEVCAQLLSRVRLFAAPWTVAHHAPLYMGFSRQEYWSGLPPPPPGDFSNPGIESASLMSLALAGKFFTTSAICMTYLNWASGRAIWLQNPRSYHLCTSSALPWAHHIFLSYAPSGELVAGAQLEAPCNAECG